MTHCFLNMVLSFQPALLTYLVFFLSFISLCKCTSPHLPDKGTFFTSMFCNELGIFAAGLCVTSQPPHSTMCWCTRPVRKVNLCSMRENNAAVVLISGRWLGCESKHLAVVQLVAVWWWWHCSPFHPPQQQWQAQCAAVQVMVTYKNTVPAGWAEVTHNSFLPAAISLNI